MKILLLIQWCKPEPDFKCIPVAKALMTLGHEVEVLTGFPNYPEGKLYDGYKIKLFQKELIDGVPVTRVPLFPSHDRSSVRRALNYLSFAVSASLIGAAVTKRPDVVYVYNPMGLPAIYLRWIKRVPYVYDIQDLWPDSISASGMATLGVASNFLINQFFKVVYRRAEKILVQSEGFKKTLVERGVESRKIEVLFNWCDEDALLNHPTLDAVRDLKKVEIVYAGNMGGAQNLFCLIDAAKQLRFILPQVRFTLIGGGTDLPYLKAKAAGLSNVFFINRLSQRDTIPYLLRASALFVHLKESPLFEITIPSKIQFYMAVGKPIIAGVSGDAETLIKRAAAGVVFKPGNSSSLVDAIRYFTSMADKDVIAMGRNGARYYKNDLSLDVAVKRLEHIFLEAVRDFNNLRR